MEALEDLVQHSFEIPCLIYKHSHRCHVCTIAQYRLEDDWSFESQEVAAYFVDVIAHRPISQAIAERFQVYHESPQVLLISRGDCMYDASHLDIRFEALKEAIDLMHSQSPS